VTIAETLSRAQVGLSAPLVHVEVHLAAGLPSFNLVGLPAPVVRESRERVRAAIVNSGYEFPPGRITVNLAPVELAKEGGRFDLPIALGLLRASGQARWQPEASFECYGELGLGGELKPVTGLLLAALHARRAGHRLVLPADNLPEARRVAEQEARGFRSLRAVCDYLTGTRAVADALGADAGEPTCALQTTGEIVSPEIQSGTLDDVLGQQRAKRALTIAAAGGHSLLLMGPPGSGKSLLAGLIGGLLPPLSEAEALEVACIGCVANGGFDFSQWGRRPFRAPHHSASASAIIGGGPRLGPGEISLAHCGVLFMDEFPEFDRRVLESLREPLESNHVTLARAGGRLELPAAFQLVAAMNPCPCGHWGDEAEPCRCSQREIERYRGRISGPLWDRIDLRVEVRRQEMKELLPGLQDPAIAAVSSVDRAGAGVSLPTHAELQRQVLVARALQQRRAACLNSRLPVQRLAIDCTLDEESRGVLERCQQRVKLTGRGLHRVLRVARTIADLDGCRVLRQAHVAEAVQFHRPMV
jgi:magnesium chelatase family protein